LKDSSTTRYFTMCMKKDPPVCYTGALKGGQGNAFVSHGLDPYALSGARWLRFVQQDWHLAAEVVAEMVSLCCLCRFGDN
jgi:hypothetical protein